MHIFSKTDIGLVRKENQDSSAYHVFSRDCCWAVICDGMGGVNGGKIASAIAVETITEAINLNYDYSMTGDEISEMLIAAVSESNTCIYNTALRDPDLAGMGTTCDLVFIRGESAYVVHVGDSRTYSIRGDKILQITEDHSLVQEMVNRGELTPEEAQSHPNKNLITRAIGVSRNVHIDYIETEFLLGDTILICSDGLSNYVSRTDMAAAVNTLRGELLIDTLVERAKSHGGNDNITVTVIY